MTIRYSPETGNIQAQCDDCQDIIDFDEHEDFDNAKAAIDADGWKTRREDGTWQNICPDCH